MLTIFCYWFGVSLVAFADTMTVLVGGIIRLIADCGFALCTRAHRHGYDFASRLSLPAPIQYEVVTETVEAEVEEEKKTTADTEELFANAI